MTSVLTFESGEAKQAVSTLFESKPPVLVEARFPRMATSPDWYLCEDEDQLAEILDKLGTGVEVYLRSVWDLKDTRDEICLKKS